MRRPWAARQNARHVAKSELVLELKREQTMIDGRIEGQPKDASRAVLKGLDLTGADLRMANLQGADLREAKLSDALFDGADLSWAILDGAELQSASFAQARITEATFRNADLTGCNFTGVTGLSPSTVRGASSLQGVRWPDGFAPSERGVGGPLIHQGPPKSSR